MASEIKIEAWIHAITVMARVHGWFVSEYPSRAHSPSHLCLKDGKLLVVFARPSGGKLMAQHVEPHKQWMGLAMATDLVFVAIATPERCEDVWAVLSGTEDLRLLDR